jgi:hypothetical protein
VRPSALDVDRPVHATWRRVRWAADRKNQTLSASTTEVGILKLRTSDDSGEKPFGFERFNFTPGEGEVNMYAGIPDSQNVGGRLVWPTESGKVLTFVFRDETNAFGATNCVIGGTVVAG